MERVTIGTRVCIVSARTGTGFGELEEFSAGGNVVCLGSSGVASRRSANRLLGQMVQEVQPVRESDSRGRHTTTRVKCSSCGRSAAHGHAGLARMQLWDAEDGLRKFLRTLIAGDESADSAICRHEGGRMRGAAALDTGTLDRARVESRRKLLQEQEFLRRKVDPEARQEHKEQWKQIIERRGRNMSREKRWGKRLRRRLLCRVMRETT